MYYRNTKIIIIIIIVIVNVIVIFIAFNIINIEMQNCLFIKHISGEVQQKINSVSAITHLTRPWVGLGMHHG